MEQYRLPASNQPIDDRWQDRAECIGSDPELFFPDTYKGPNLKIVQKAKAVCERCTVTEQCAEYALNAQETDGIWGGLTPDERRAIWRKVIRGRQW